jgi:hypothetical protein
LLGGYAAKQCPRRIHNDWDSTIAKVEWEPAAELQARFDAGIAFEAHVFAALRSTLGKRCVDLSHVERKQERMVATVTAMDACVEVILGGQLPDDPSGGRTGKPDLLLCVSGDSGRPAYIPGDVKAHRTVKVVSTKTLRYSRPAVPTQARTAGGYAEMVGDRFDDFIQLAHYARMLEACGYAPSSGSRWGVIIGNDDIADLDPSGTVLVWHDLTEPVFQTFARSSGKMKRSALDRSYVGSEPGFPC